jgi:hypothetical protein
VGKSLPRGFESLLLRPGRGTCGRRSRLPVPLAPLPRLRPRRCPASGSRPERPDRPPRTGVPFSRRASPEGVDLHRNPSNEGARDAPGGTRVRFREARRTCRAGEGRKDRGHEPLMDLGFMARRRSKPASRQASNLRNRGGAPVSGPEGAPPRTAPTPAPTPGAAQSQPSPSREGDDLWRCMPLCGSSFVLRALISRSGARST